MILALPLLPSLISSQPPSHQCWEQPDQAQNPSSACTGHPESSQGLITAPKHTSLASHAPHCPQHCSCSSSHQSSCLWGHHPGPSLTLLMLWQRLLSLEGEGCPKRVHVWLAGKAGEPLDSTQRYPAAQPGGGRSAWTLAGVGSGAGCKRKDAGSQLKAWSAPCMRH